MSEKEHQGFTRRDFLAKSALVGAGAAALGTFGGLGTGTAFAEPNPGIPDKWDREADVVVLGYGGAGASAAIEAAKAGSSVIILEKAPSGLEGGNTSCAGGGWLVISDRAKGIKFVTAQYLGTTDEAEIAAFAAKEPVVAEEIAGFVDEVMGTADWIKSIGGNVGPVGNLPGILYPNLPGADGVPGSQNATGPGSVLFATLKKAVDGLSNIKVLYETPGERLIFDPATREVYGVYAEAAGARIAVKARKGVVLALGGYENDQHLVWNFFAPATRIYPWGTPFNTGDGLPMIAEIGAKLRHFSSVEWGSYCCKKASDDAGFAVSLGYTSPQFANAILVNKYGKRFVSENRPSAGFLPSPTHDKEPLPQMAYSLKNMEYPNGQFFMVFDETRRAAGPLCTMAAKGTAAQSWAIKPGSFQWSQDNQAEIAAGYVLKADTIAELATKAGIDPVELQATVDKWNAAVDAGTDDEFERAAQLSKITTAPFYITEMALSFINTQGGADRNAKHEVLDWEGTPIPRLYAAGEFGSVYGFLYQGAGNIPEALGGRVAGASAAAQPVRKEATSVKLSENASAIRLGEAVMLKVALKGGTFSGTYVNIMVKRPGSSAYKLLKKVKVTAAGAASYKYRPTKKGTYYHRVNFLGSANFLPSKSAAVKLTVR